MHQIEFGRKEIDEIFYMETKADKQDELENETHVTNLSTSKKKRNHVGESR